MSLPGGKNAVRRGKIGKINGKRKKVKVIRGTASHLYSFIRLAEVVRQLGSPVSSLRHGPTLLLSQTWTGSVWFICSLMS